MVVDRLALEGYLGEVGHISTTVVMLKVDNKGFRRKHMPEIY